MKKLMTAVAAAALILAMTADAFAQSGGGGSSGGSSSGGSSSSGSAAGGGSATTGGGASRPVGNPMAPANRGATEVPDATATEGALARGSSGRPAGRYGDDGRSAIANENKADDPSLNQGIYRTSPSRP